MAKILIAYYSKSGNTRKMAEAVAEGAKEIHGTKVEVKDVDETELDDLLKADAIILGSPTYYGQMSSKIKALVDESVKIHGKLEGKIGAAFTSSGGVACGAETTLLSMLHAMLVHGMIIQGRHRHRHYGATAVGSPNEEEIKECRDLGQSVATLAIKLFS